MAKSAAEEKDLESKDQDVEGAVELESQFLLSLPTTPAAALRAAVRSGVMNLKDRLLIDIEPDMRHSKVVFDKWTLSGKIMDLPTIVESYKTLDCKTFYKTADICQVMVCKEDDEVVATEETEKKKDKKDSKDKRFVLPHGVTPPLKNVRKRRFRKTLKKKYIDFPAIEKEVKRLFRMDNEAISVRYEVVNADDDKGEEGEKLDETEETMMAATREQHSLDVAEYDIFGEVLSSSDGEANAEEQSSQTRDVSKNVTTPASCQPSTSKAGLVTEFSKSMLEPLEYQLESATAEENLGQILKEHKTDEERTVLLEKLDELEHEIADVLARRRAQELEIMSIENQALKQRFQCVIDNLKQQETDKQKEYDEIVMMLHQT